MRGNPLQAELWRNVLVMAQPAKVWAIVLDEDASVIARWATGERPCSLDDLARCSLALRTDGKNAAAVALEGRVTAVFAVPDAEPRDGSALELVAGLHSAASAAVGQILAGVADGVLDEDERDAIRRNLDRLEAELARARRAVAGRPVRSA